MSGGSVYFEGMKIVHNTAVVALALLLLPFLLCLLGKCYIYIIGSPMFASWPASTTVSHITTDYEVVKNIRYIDKSSGYLLWPDSNFTTPRNNYLYCFFQWYNICSSL